MCNRRLITHVCASVTLALALLALMCDLYGQPYPSCDNSIPGSTQSCAMGTNCTAIDPDSCNDISSVCQVANQVVGPCQPGNPTPPFTVLCQNSNVICTRTYKCFWNPSRGTCECSDTPVLDSEGKPVVSLTSSGFFVTCVQPPS